MANTYRTACPYIYRLLAEGASSDRIIGHLVDAGQLYGYWDDRLFYPFSYDVKAHSANLLPEHLWDKQDGPDHLAGRGLYTTDPEKLAVAKGLFAKYLTEVADEYELFNTALEYAQNSLRDCYQSVWDGTAVLTEYSFGGRSGGHLMVDSWGRMPLGFHCRGDFEEALKGLEQEELRLLYKFSVEWRENFTRAKASEAVEYEVVSLAMAVLEEDISAAFAKIDRQRMPPLRYRNIRIKRTG